jgi:hypothetical protein
VEVSPLIITRLIIFKGIFLEHKFSCRGLDSAASSSTTNEAGICKVSLLQNWLGFLCV